jgi:hypothetical protein
MQDSNLVDDLGTVRVEASGKQLMQRTTSRELFVHPPASTELAGAITTTFTLQGRPTIIVADSAGAWHPIDRQIVVTLLKLVGSSVDLKSEAPGRR